MISDSDREKKVVRKALVRQLEANRLELQAMNDITNVDQLRSRCSSTIISVLRSLSTYLDDAEIRHLLADIATLTQQYIFFTTRSTLDKNVLALDADIPTLPLEKKEGD
jgi:hypothetical protein